MADKRVVIISLDFFTPSVYILQTGSNNHTTVWFYNPHHIVSRYLYDSNNCHSFIEGIHRVSHHHKWRQYLVDVPGTSSWYQLLVPAGCWWHCGMMRTTDVTDDWNSIQPWTAIYHAYQKTTVSPELVKME